MVLQRILSILLILPAKPYKIHSTKHKYQVLLLFDTTWVFGNDGADTLHTSDIISGDAGNNVKIDIYVLMQSAKW